ncbi:MAG: VCBS repeat-containing protein [Bryobacterales bacterium]
MAQISQATFEHHTIAEDLPSRTDWGYGMPTLADYDGDGDLDFTVSSRVGEVYWFEQKSVNEWTRHKAGDVVMGQLGATSLDVDRDGHVDFVIGGYWYRNPGNPRQAEFERFEYDPTIQREIHDVVTADIDGDGREDVVAHGDGDGLFWYSIPADPTQPGAWKRVTITLDVLEKNDFIHSGVFPHGVGDLDGDGDADVFATDRWFENEQAGRKWTKHRLPFGSRGPYGISSRSWIVDMDEDGDADIVATHGDQQNSAVAWLENDGKTPPNFEVHYLPNLAPGTRGSFHSLAVADFDLDGDLDIMTVEQEDTTIPPVGVEARRWFVFENLGGLEFAERVVFDGKLGGHDILVGDVDGDGDPDVVSKIWKRWAGSDNDGRFHADLLENKAR